MAIVFETMRCHFRIHQHSTDWVLMEHRNLAQLLHPHSFTLFMDAPTARNKVCNDSESDFLKRSGPDLNSRPTCHPCQAFGINTRHGQVGNRCFEPTHTRDEPNIRCLQREDLT